jgi:hypothetical protein
MRDREIERLKTENARLKIEIARSDDKNAELEKRPGTK